MRVYIAYLAFLELCSCRSDAISLTPAIEGWSSIRSSVACWHQLSSRLGCPSMLLLSMDNARIRRAMWSALMKIFDDVPAL